MNQTGTEVDFCLIGGTGPSLFGLDTAARLRKQFGRLGKSRELTIEQARQESAGVVFLRADAVIDQPIVAVLAQAKDLVLVGHSKDGELPVAVCTGGSGAGKASAILAGKDRAETATGLVRKRPEDLKAGFWKALRKRETPYAFAVSADNARTVEWRMFLGTYKGATDIVTKHLWPRPAFHVTRWLAGAGVSPNMVTALAAVLTALAFWFFLKGQFAPGLAAAWAMTFLDTVDGKLARTTLTSSKWGDIFDHGIDLVHPPFWYAAWAIGLERTGIVWPPHVFWWVLAVIIAGYVFQRAFEGIAIKWLGLEIHIWRPIDTLFRQVTARRNPNLVILTMSVLVARPDIGLIAVAAWTAICLVLHLIQLMQALGERRRGPLTSWMMDA